MHPIDIAVGIASRAHAGTLDKDGYPYILHPLTVGVMGNTDDEKIAGFLHDVVEDTDWTFDDLLREGIPASVVNALKLLVICISHHTHCQRVEYVRVSVFVKGAGMSLGGDADSYVDRVHAVVKV